MKEIIVIEDRDLVNYYKNSFNSNVKLVSVPETFEELKELVDNYDGKFNKQISGYSVGKTAITIVFDGTNIHFDKDGIFFYFTRYKRTPAQMWQIIKNLIGEE